jgi:transcriptional regulator with GAF, ATPase, and Fis domain
MSEDDVTQLATQPARELPDRSAPTLVLRDAAGEQRIVIDRRLLLGTAEGADVRLRDRLVSRVHAELELRDDGAWIRDLGSRNGTFVNELCVVEARLPNRARIRVGTTQLTVRFEQPEPRPIELWHEERFGRMLGATTVMRRLFATLHRVAATESPVLIHGETGTGKELVAEAIHGASKRRDGAFVTIDCAALPEALLEAELFGHTRGAFTGAVSARAGAFETADGGTVFLDEIGELPPAIQPKLLRVLEAKTIRRLGESTHRAIDVRVIGATHRDLPQMVARGEFREDLYFRLCVLPVAVPPLRARRDDVPALLSFFFGGELPLSAEQRAALVAHAWRGNVRELRNFVERVRALDLDAALTMLGLTEPEERATRPAEAAPEAAAAAAAVAPPPPPPLADAATFEADYHSFREGWIDRGEAEYVRRLLDRHAGNVSNAASAAGLARTYLYRLIRKHGL